MMFRITNPTRVLQALWLSASLLMLVVCASEASAQTAAFTYQGRLTDGGTPASGNYDLQFALFDSVSGGAQVGTTQTVPAVAVSAGVFSVQLDFGANAFPGAPRFLEIGAKLPSGAAFTTLSPRQPITSTPYAVRSLNASSADTVTVNGVPGGSGNYIQNSPASQQTGANFNISGNGTAAGTLSAGTVNATTQYNIGGSRVLSSNAGAFNLFAGVGAGPVNTGAGNSFFGADAGFANTSGSSNSFFGALAGRSNPTGSDNSFFGATAGSSNNTGESNSFFGAFAAGNNNTGKSNSVFGAFAGNSNTTEDNNTFIGRSSNGAAGITNATALGYRAQVTQSNSLVLGSINTVNGATADTNVGIGTTLPQYKLHVVGQNVNVRVEGSDFPHFSLNYLGGAADGKRWQNYAATSSLMFTALNDAENAETTWLQVNRGTGTAISSVVLPNGNVGIGTSTPAFKLTIFDALNTGLRVTTAGSGGTVASFGGNGAFQVDATGVAGGRLNVSENGNVGIGTAGPIQKLDVTGNIRLGTGTNGCVEDRDGTVIAGACSSDLRFKRDVSPFGSILSSFSKLRPVNFYWRKDEFAEKHFGTKQSFGLIAQEVEQAFPDLVSTDEQGYKVVNYSKLPLLTIQAVNEQQQAIQDQQLTVTRQQAQIETLRAENAALSARLRSVEKIVRKKAGSLRRRR